MKFKRNHMTLAMLLLLAPLLGPSCESTSSINKPQPAWLELRIEKSSGAAPDTITFVGILHGDIDTLRMSCPDDYSFCPSTYPKGCIIYWPPCDSTQSAKRTYVDTYIYQSPGTYEAIMVLHCCNGDFSDTLAVRVP